MTIKPSIWTSCEVDAWSRGMAYDSYLEYHHRRQEVARPLREEAYELLVNAFEAQMVLDIQHGTF